MMRAAAGGQEEILKILLARRADPQGKDLEDNTGLHHAASGHSRCLQILLKKDLELEVLCISNRWSSGSVGSYTRRR